MAFLDFLFPKKCLGCGKKGKYFCDECVAKTELIERPICPICVKPFPFGQTHHHCQTRYTIDGLTSVFVYEGIIREGIKQLKYRFYFDLADELGTILLNRNVVNPAQFLDLKKTVIVPVPLHRWRQDWRGFNQAALLAQILARKLNLPFCGGLLVRTRYTEPQTGLKKEERKRNVERAFEVNEKYISVNPRAAQKEIDDTIKARAPLNQRKSRPLGIVLPTSVLLFDDVWTTGATMKVCAKLLKRAGFKKVWGLTVAR